MEQAQKLARIRDDINYLSRRAGQLAQAQRNVDKKIALLQRQIVLLTITIIITIGWAFYLSLTTTQWNTIKDVIHHHEPFERTTPFWS